MCSSTVGNRLLRPHPNAAAWRVSSARRRRRCAWTTRATAAIPRKAAETASGSASKRSHRRSSRAPPNSHPVVASPGRHVPKLGRSVSMTPEIRVIPSTPPIAPESVSALLAAALPALDAKPETLVLMIRETAAILPMEGLIVSVFASKPRGYRILFKERRTWTNCH